MMVLSEMGLDKSEFNIKFIFVKLFNTNTPAAVIFKATWPEEKIFRCTVGTLHETVTKNNLTKTSLIIVGGCLGDDYMRSLLYHPAFTTEFREATL